MQRDTVLLTVVATLVIVVARGHAQCPSPIEAGYQAAYKYLGNSADDDDHGGLFNQTNGLANGDPSAGDPYWYFSKHLWDLSEGHRLQVFRVHYSEHLAHNFEYDLVDLTSATGCAHMGDIDYFVDPFDGDRYLVAALDNCSGPATLVFLRVDEINWDGPVAPLSVFETPRPQGVQAGWVCVGNDGKVYSSRNHGEWIVEYDIDWADVRAGVSPPGLLGQREILLTDEEGFPFPISRKQGGDLSTDGAYFYLCAGTTESSAGGKRIWAFRTQIAVSDWRLERVATNGSCPFNFETEDWDNEPEGLSYFDMNDVSVLHAGMPRGELHVELLNKDFIFPPDNIWIKHYSSAVRTDPVETLNYTYDVLCDGADGVWDRQIIVLDPGMYDETIVIDRNLLLKVDCGGGSAVIGDGG